MRLFPSATTVPLPPSRLLLPLGAESEAFPQISSGPPSEAVFCRVDLRLPFSRSLSPSFFYSGRVSAPPSLSLWILIAYRGSYLAQEMGTPSTSTQIRPPVCPSFFRSGHTPRGAFARLVTGFSLPRPVFAPFLADRDSPWVDVSVASCAQGNVYVSVISSGPYSVISPFVVVETLFLQFFFSPCASPSSPQLCAERSSRPPMVLDADTVFFTKSFFRGCFTSPPVIPPTIRG